MKDIGRILFWFPVRWFVLIIPMNTIRRMGKWFGELDYFISGTKRRHRMSKNISDSLHISLKDAQNIVRKNLSMNIINTLELMKYPNYTKTQVVDGVIFDGFDRLNAGLNRGKGVILLTAHFGTKQMLQIALGLLGYAVTQIHFHMGKDELSFVQKFVAQKQRKKIESKIPARFISANGFLRPAFRCLKENQVLIMAGDGVGLKKRMDKSYRSFNILEKKMWFPTGPYSLARRTRSAIIPTFAFREQGGGHRIKFETPIDIDNLGIMQCAGEYVSLLESYVRRYPWHWEFWEEFDEDVLVTKADVNIDASV